MKIDKFSFLTGNPSFILKFYKIMKKMTSGLKIQAATLHEFGKEKCNSKRGRKAKQ